MRDSAPWLAAAATLLLCAGFWLPLGAERKCQTTYRAFQGLEAAFGPAPDGAPHPAAPVAAPARGEANPAAARPEKAVSRRRRRFASPRGTSAGKRRGKRETPAASAPARPSRPSYPEPPAKPSAPSPLEGVPRPAPPAPAAPSADDSADAVRDAYDSCDSRFPLDVAAAQGGVTLRLAGLCRWRGHYIVRVAVTNEADADFFVRELSAYDGRDFVTLKSYFRLLVEPGRTRDGFVLFDARPGAQVHVALKEDRDDGRVLNATVRYPF